MYVTGIFMLIIMAGLYFVYVKPKKDVINRLRSDPSFSHYILIVESNSEFDKVSYDKVMKHLRIFMMYYSQAFDDELMFGKMQNQYGKIIKYLNRMMFSIPNSMKRHSYMQYAIQNIELLLKDYMKEIATKYDIHYIPI